MITLRHGFERPGAEPLRRFERIPTADIVDAMGGSGAIDYRIRSLFPANAFVGSALTVQTPPNDNLAPFIALDLVQPGDVVMISTRDFTAGATIGDTLLAFYQRRGVVAVVIDGLVRDLARLREIGVPVYARGLSPNAPHKNGPGSVGSDIVLGGVAVSSGDLVVGDVDGIAVVPRLRAEAVLQAVTTKMQSSTGNVSQPRDMPEWVESFLKSDRVRRI